MRDMTDNEYDALDERLTNTVPTLGPNGTGFFSRKSVPVVEYNKNNVQNLNPSILCKEQLLTPVQG